MELVKIQRQGYNPVYGSLTIDPGLVSTGFCYIDFNTNNVKIDTMYTELNSLSSIFKDNFLMSEFQFNRYLDYIKSLSIDFKNLQINIEHSVYNPDFTSSIGLNIFLTYAIKSFIDLGVNHIIMIPPKTPSFFLRTKDKLRDSEIKKWLKYFVPKFYSKSLTSHSMDALLHSIFIHFDYYITIHELCNNIRKPEFTIINV